MSLHVLDRARRYALHGRHRLRRGLAGGLLTAAAAFLVAAGPASAYSLNPITPASGWSANVCCAGGTPGWYRDAFGIIHLEGAVTTPNVQNPSSLIAVLPPAARPNRNVFTIVHTFGGTYADLAIDTQGRIGVIAPQRPAARDFSYVSLEGVSYQPANQLPANPIEINQNNWIQHWQGQFNSFGASDPAWYKDPFGVVHLQGATRQFPPQPGLLSNPTLIGAVPPAAAPSRTISTVVHTFNGTYADLFIFPSGAIVIAGPPAPSPNLSDFSFVSLEGVSYQTTPLSNVTSLNSANWAPGLGPSSAPGFVVDSAGIIHLQGEVNQTSSTGPNAGLIATLPGAARPRGRQVYVIAKMANGNGYVDLVISLDGGIRVINPTLYPGQNAIVQLSLDSIAYQPSDVPGPHALSFTPTGDVLALLDKPRTLELAVFKLGPHAHQLGTVKLGNAPAGRSRFRWSLSVAGHRLTEGTYIAELVAVPARGKSIAGGPGVTFALTGQHRLRVLSATCSLAHALSHRC